MTGCASGYYDQNGSFSDGCECKADSVGNTCASATDLGSVTIGGGSSFSANIVPTTDVDWYKLTFQNGPTCSFKPTITLTTNGAPIAMQIVGSSCSGSGISCNEGGSSNSSGYTSWEFTYSNTCGDKQPIDPTPGTTGSFIDPSKFPSPTVVYIKVYATGSSTTCMPYTLQWTN